MARWTSASSRRLQQRDPGHHRRRPRRLDRGLGGRSVRGPAAATGSSRTVGGPPGTATASAKWPTPTRRASGPSKRHQGPPTYTGTMYFSGTDYTNPANLSTGIDATATWKGTSNSVWNTSTANWQNNGTGAASPGSTRKSAPPSKQHGQPIGHHHQRHGHRPQPDLQRHAATRSHGGALTVTAGGITANENVTILSPITIGGPQAWTAGRRHRP